ncbi:hypothetical protein EVAR_39567_1 [Eumeta japonica]|uniref:Uncharacterized protein n=1 Tax=Eumeta variegata TaxID=151549 RepID=A0A4C1XMY8_EUMVA|nr:hypothetical protein EVAR_39567_1 [Eumeta japonica]
MKLTSSRCHARRGARGRAAAAAISRASAPLNFFYSYRDPSDSRIITSAYQRVLENRPIVPNQEGAGRPVRSEAQERVLDLVRQKPRLSTRTAARLLRRNHEARVSH